jgi:HAD superfamily hydrolase (TIGR01509 family)
MHFLAYKKMLERRGFQLLWDFQRYCQTAHYHADTIAGELYALFPELMQQEPSWEVLYAEKKAAMFELIAEGHVQLMAGVEELLTSLLTSGKRCCVVTHSPLDLVAQIRQKQPLLNSIPRWITRHDYQQPKPASECYLKAIATYAEEHEAVVGFEDSPRGLRALMGSRAIAVMISQVDYPEIPQFMAAGARYYRSFVELQVKASAKGAVEREENF